MKAKSKKKIIKKSNTNYNKTRERNFNLMLLVTFFLGVLFIVSAYAWFQASLDVQVKMVNLVVSRKNGLFISLDGINFGSSVEISEENLINNLKNTYPSNTSQWASDGLYPVSSAGLKDSNSYKLNFYESYAYEIDPLTNKSYLTTREVREFERNSKKSYIAFDVFLKNITGSPVSDNLYIDEGTNIILESEPDDQIQGLLNSVRFGFVRIGTVPRTSSVEDIQRIGCNNECEALIYEPNATKHTEFSIERVKKLGVNLLDGQYYPTFAITGSMDFFEVTDVINGVPTENFDLQMTRVDIERPIFELPDGITKMRIYVWLEGQDIDSLETKSKGANASIIINLIKDTAGFDAFNE